MENAFQCENGLSKFEEAGATNGATHWAEHLVRETLGYQTEVSFKNVINKAMQTCLTAGVPIEEIPVVQATRYSFGLNLKTCRQVGIEPPKSLIKIADLVIE